jgi:alpha-L-fucosidase
VDEGKPRGRATKQVDGNTTTLYLHVFSWPADGKLLVPGLRNTPQKAYLLADAKKSLTSEVGAEGLVLTVRSTAPDPISSTVVLKIKGPLDIQQATIVQDYDGAVTLAASEARTHGDEVKFESGDSRDNIGFWTNPADWVDWEFTVTKPGKFNVSAEIAAPEKTSFEVSLKDQKIQGAAPVTGDYGKFKQTKVGVVEIASPGKVTIAVRPVTDGWHPMNLKALRLTPAAK